MKAKENKTQVLTTEPRSGWGGSDGLKVWIDDKETGLLHRGTVRLKAVKCGKKGCTKCPHKIYAYAQFRVGGLVTEKYLGVAR